MAGGRGPDPQREGTVYRSGTRLRLRGLGRRPDAGVRGPSGGPPLDETRVDPSPGRVYRNGVPVDDGAGPAARRPAGTATAPPVRRPPDRPLGGERGAALPRGRRRRRWPWVAAAVVLLLVVYGAALFLSAWSHLTKVAAIPAGGPAATPGRTFLVVGSDSRASLTPAQRKLLHTGKVGGGRTDTIMLLHVPDGGGPTVLVSVPRDSYVSIPGHGKNKINSAYAFGGPQLLVRTVEQATGLRIDDYVETGLGGYADLVDAVGGVDVCVKRAMNDAKAHLNVKAGCQQFDGPTALAYARARYSDPRGDLGRVERQRQVLAAIAGKTLSPATILQPWRALPAASAGGTALTVDEGTTPLGLYHFVMAMRAVAGGGGLSLTVPIGDAALQTPAGEAVSWDRTKAGRLFTALRSDDTEAIRPLAAAEKG